MFTRKEIQRRYRQKHADSLRKKNREYRQENPDVVARWTKNYRKTANERSLAFYFRNRERILHAAAVYVRGREAVDLNFRIVRRLRTRLWFAVRGVGVSSSRTLELLGCSIPELRRFLEAKFQPGMSWENYGPVWHVDHKRPCAAFDLTDSAQQRECFHYTNLQPLFAEENRRKGANLDYCLGNI